MDDGSTGHDSTSAIPAGSLEGVARRLVERYVAASSAKAEPYRTIVVVGAGASHAACGLPTAGDMAKEIEKRVAKEIPQRLIEEELDRLSDAYRLPRDAFETKLLALGRYDSKKVLDRLCQICNFSHYPSLTYELIAHLLKHGFVDAVVNFNFDELLDQAISEELGPDRYVRIVRDGGWSRSLRADPNAPSRFDLPLYIKPHGTVSDPASLRFTREAYQALPPEIGRLLGSMVRGDPAQSYIDRSADPSADGVDDEKGAIPICVLTLGHGMASFEFNRLFKRVPASSELYEVQYEDPPSPKEREWPDAMVRTARAVRIGKPGYGLDDLLDDLWRRIAKEVRSTAMKDPWLSVRDIARHRLIAHLFHATHFGKLKRAPNSEALRNYLEDRLTIELCLAIAKSRGFVDLRELHRGRVGSFYQELLDNNYERIRSVSARLEEFGLKRQDYSSESYFLPPGEPGVTVENLTLPRILFPRDGLLESCKKFLTPNRLARINKKGQKLFEVAILEMLDGDEVEVSPARADDYRYKFASTRPLRTLAEMKRETGKLNASEWDMLLCVAESGEWLLDNPKALGADLLEKKVGVIVADTVQSRGLDTKHIVVRRLPWHLHNRHMSIWLKDDGNSFRPVKTIYFERRYRSSRISPVILTEEEDLTRAMGEYTVYWLKAEAFEKKKSEVFSLSARELDVAKARMVRDVVRGPVSGERPMR